jgi:membrane-associated phospholipid phosphatase
MHNDKHWFSDVVAGAGIGILATKITYWVYPEVRRLIAHKKSGLTILPIAGNDFAGLIIQYKMP